MSITGPGCAHCDGGRVTNEFGDVRPCDRCGGFSQFARAVAPEDDFRPLPSVAEVLAHNARLGGGFTSSPWLCVSDSSDMHADVRVVWLAIGRNDRVMCVGGSPDPTTDPDARVRPITRRGEALPWPEVTR